MKPVIEVENLKFSYKTKQVLDDIRFSVFEGDFVAMTGANGAGKSTILKLLLGELTPAAGSIRLLGQDVSQFRDWPSIGYVPQKSLVTEGSFPATAEEIVLANLYPQIGLMRFPKKAHREKARKALAMVGLQEEARTLIGAMSGGQQQRVMIARVLVSEPKIMILDEPTTGIDAQTVKALYELLSQLNQENGLTILMVTHDLARASAYVSRIFCLEEDSLLELEKTQILDELSHKHKHPAREAQTAGSKGEGAGHGHS